MIKTIAHTLKDYDFKVLDFATDGGINEIQKVIAFFKGRNPHIEITNEIVVDIARYINCVYKTKLQTTPKWSDISIIYDGSCITCSLDDYKCKARINLSHNEISVEVSTDFDTKFYAKTLLASENDTVGMLISTDLGLLATQKAIAQIKETVIKTLISSITSKQ